MILGRFHVLGRSAAIYGVPANDGGGQLRRCADCGGKFFAMVCRKKGQRESAVRAGGDDQEGDFAFELGR